MGDVFWWRTYRSGRDKMLDALAELAQGLGRLPTEEEARARQIQVSFSERCPNYAALMREVAVHVGKFREWQAQLAEIRAREKQLTERDALVAAERARKQREILQVYARKQAERKQGREAEEMQDMQIVRAHEDLAKFATRPKKLAPKLVKTTAPMSKTVQTETKNESEKLEVVEVDLKGVQIKMSRTFTDQKMYEMADEIIQQANGAPTMAQIQNYINTHNDSPCLATFTKRLGAPRYWEEVLQRAIADGKFVSPTPLETEAGAASPSEVSGPGSEAVTLGAEQAPASSEPAELRQPGFSAEVPIEMCLTGHADLKVIWQGQAMNIRLTFGENV